jgi:flagellar hook assembly protein FlgD
LLDDEKGKSLERINPSGPSNNPDNWQTASETVGWGTPGIQNSQFLNPQALGQFSIDPTVISPDNDGFEDFAIFTYDLPEVGMLGKISIYDENGRPVRELVNNFYFDLAGELKWDGLDDSGVKCRIGRYLVVFEAFSAQTGTTINFRKAVVVAGRI